MVIPLLILKSRTKGVEGTRFCSACFGDRQLDGNRYCGKGAWAGLAKNAQTALKPFAA
jgi:hypothetical protein